MHKKTKINNSYFKNNFDFKNKIKNKLFIKYYISPTYFHCWYDNQQEISILDL